MTRVLDDAAIERAFRAAERALAEGDPDPRRPLLPPTAQTRPQSSPPQHRRLSAPRFSGEAARAFRDETLPKDAYQTAPSAACAAPNSAA